MHRFRWKKNAVKVISKRQSSSPQTFIQIELPGNEMGGNGKHKEGNEGEKEENARSEETTKREVDKDDSYAEAIENGEDKSKVLSIRLYRYIIRIDLYSMYLHQN